MSSYEAKKGYPPARLNNLAKFQADSPRKRGSQDHIFNVFMSVPN